MEGKPRPRLQAPRQVWRLAPHVLLIRLSCSSGTPAGLSYMEVRASLSQVKGVTAVHNLHIWALTMNQAVLTAHVAIGEEKPLTTNHHKLF